MADKNPILLDTLPWIIFGSDGEENDQGDSNDESGDDSNDDEQNAGNASGDSSDDDLDDDIDDDDPAKGLKSALKKERAEAKRLARELKALKRAEEDRQLAEQSELEQLKVKAERYEEKVTRLAEGLRTRELNSAITRAAENLGFIDTDDALNGVDISEIPVEQDEDDPSDITIDTKAVERAVKALAAKKPHFLKKGTNDGEDTGSKFGGSRKKRVNPEDALREKYPALNN